MIKRTLMTRDTSNTELRTTRILLLLAVMLALGAIVYSNTFDSPLVFDDEFFIINDTAVHMAELSGDAIKTAALDGKPRHRYLPNISFALNYYFGQLNPFGYHLVNLIIHLLTGIFLFLLIKDTLRIHPGDTGSIRPEIFAFFAALIWVVQPVGTQSVTYICQRMASMVALFYILSLLLYVRGRMAMRQHPPLIPPSRGENGLVSPSRGENGLVSPSRGENGKGSVSPSRGENGLVSPSISWTGVGTPPCPPSRGEWNDVKGDASSNSPFEGIPPFDSPLEGEPPYNSPLEGEPPYNSPLEGGPRGVSGPTATYKSPKLIPGLYFSGSLLAFICAIATKENAGTLPLAILLYEWFFFQDLKLAWSRRQVLWISFIVIVFAGVVFWYMGENPMHRILNSYNRRDFSLAERVMTEWRIMIYYISLFLWAPPGRLNLDHDYPLSLTPFHPATTLAAAAAIIALLAWAAFSARKNRLAAFCILWFFITQATESTIIGIELVFEHRTYIPFMMISPLFALAVFRLFRSRRVAFILLTAAVLVFSAWTYKRNQIWQEPVNFWKDTLMKSADKPRAYKNLAFAYQQKGEWAAAVVNYKKALKLGGKDDRPDVATYANISAALIKQNRFFDAVYYYSKALEHTKSAANLFGPLAFALVRIGELEAAQHFYHLTLTVDPKDEPAQKGLTALSDFLDRFPDPYAQIGQLLVEQPDNPALVLRQGDLFYQHGRLDEAICAYQESLDLISDDEELITRAILSRLAQAYFLSGRHEDALTAYRHLMEMTPDNPMLYYNSAAVFAIQGKIPEARAFLIKAEERGLDAAERIQSDPNFEALRKLEDGN